jgi:hypothetical protein
VTRPNKFVETTAAAGDVVGIEQLNRRYLTSAPEHGHPLADGKVPGVEELLNRLQAKRLVVEGEIGFQTTVAGAEARALVKYKPKESLLVKLKNLGVIRALLKYFTKS